MLKCNTNWKTFYQETRERRNKYFI